MHSEKNKVTVTIRVLYVELMCPYGWINCFIVIITKVYSIAYINSTYKTYCENCASLGKERFHFL